MNKLQNYHSLIELNAAIGDVPNIHVKKTGGRYVQIKNKEDETVAIVSMNTIVKKMAEIHPKISSESLTKEERVAGVELCTKIIRLKNQKVTGVFKRFCTFFKQKFGNFKDNPKANIEQIKNSFAGTTTIPQEEPPRNRVSVGTQQVKKNISRNTASALPTDADLIKAKNQFEEDRKTIGSKGASQPFLTSILNGDKDAFVPHSAFIFHQANKQFIEAKFPQFRVFFEEFTQEYRKNGDLEACEPILKKIRNGIKKAYAEEDTPLSESQKELLERSITEDFSLIARSTGMEDTSAVANQGGNKSYPNVPKTIRDLNAYTGKVLASSFSLRSLSQRKNSGDDILAEPFLPVLLQEMVAEKSEIPTSGVMMTRETDLMTEGVMQINASFGHAEGVVSGIEPGDLYYVDGDFVSSIVSDEKKSRFAPAEQEGLVLKPNPKELIRKSALTEPQLKRLCAIGHKIEKAYGCPVDIEWSYIKELDQFAIFQARPIPEIMPIEPSFIDPEKIKDRKNISYGQVIVGGKANVLKLDSTNTLIVDRALDALELYKKHPKGKIKAVITRYPSPRTSHEAGYLRAQGVVLFHPEPRQFDSLKTSMHTSELLLDTQEGFALPIEKDEETSNWVKQGLRRHLAPKMQSVSSESLDLEKTQSFITELESYKKTSDPTHCENLIRTTSGRNEFDKILNAYEACENQSDKAYLLSKLLVITQTLVQKAPASESQKILGKIYRNANYLWSKRSSADPKHALFAMNWLRSAFLEEIPPGVVNGGTLRSLLGEKVERAKLNVPLVKLAELEKQEMLDIFNRSSKFIFIPQNRELWKTFCSQLNVEQLQELAKIFEILGPNLTESWLNSSFLKALSQHHGNPAQTLNTLKLELENKQNLKAIKISSQIRDCAKEFQKLSVDFNEPGQFERLNDQLKTKLLPDTLYCLNALKNTDGIGEALLAAAFDECVEAYDSCIKSLTGSPLYPQDDELKVKRFIEMLEGYHLIAKASLSDQVLKDPNLQKEAKVFLPFIADCHSQLKKISENKMTDFHGQLLSSKGTVQFGNGIGIPRRYVMHSTEDYFSTLHQSMKRIAASRSQLIREENLPKTLKDDFCDRLKKIRIEDEPNKYRFPSIQSIAYNYPEIEIHFNAPLYNHSAHFTLKARLSIEGTIESVILNSDFFIASGFYVRIRKPFILLYTHQKTKKYALNTTQNPPVTMEGDIIHISWDFKGDPVEKKPIVFGCKILQSIINFLQVFGTKLPINEDYTFLEDQPTLIDEISELPDYNMGKVYPSFLIGVNRNPSLENMTCFLRYSNLGNLSSDHFKKEYEEAFQNLLRVALTSNDRDFFVNVFLKCMQYFSTNQYTQEQKQLLKNLYLKAIHEVKESYQIKEFFKLSMSIEKLGVTENEYNLMMNVGNKIIGERAIFELLRPFTPIQAPKKTMTKEERMFAFKSGNFFLDRESVKGLHKKLTLLQAFGQGFNQPAKFMGFCPSPNAEEISIFTCESPTYEVKFFFIPENYTLEGVAKTLEETGYAFVSKYPKYCELITESQTDISKMPQELSELELQYLTATPPKGPLKEGEWCVEKGKRTLCQVESIKDGKASVWFKKDPKKVGIIVDVKKLERLVDPRRVS